MVNTDSLTVNITVISRRLLLQIFLQLLLPLLPLLLLLRLRLLLLLLLLLLLILLLLLLASVPPYCDCCYNSAESQDDVGACPCCFWPKQGCFFRALVRDIQELNNLGRPHMHYQVVSYWLQDEPTAEPLRRKLQGPMKITAHYL